jgi:signal transduction histidine kinase
MALHYSNPAKNKCAYILENYDNEWREVGNQHVASYPMLPPGEYVFRVKAANNNGVWNEQGASLKIIINPPWWKTRWAYALYLLIFALAIFVADRYFRNRVIQKERERNRTRELEQAREIEKAYTELKATQSQLIQSEKMASLGELTAGIAHEIQNPLNFVNNFSEINTELIDEMQLEMDKGNLADAKAISNDIKDNEQKINHHGKRADAIVKGMLQHSRNNSGLKEPTDINALADEYLRLAYHGLRAKDKSFNATLKTDFDETIGKINIIPQDIGRVVLNLITNAFYAVAEKKNQHPEGYEPTVTVSTQLVNPPPGGTRGVKISVKDNGNGIPQKILEKIFQPFFTTKPAGQGTGLGLSLAYDIVKTHGGELKVETKEKAGSKFIIYLNDDGSK